MSKALITSMGLVVKHSVRQPVLESVLVEAKAGHLTMTGTNLDMWLKCDLGPTEQSDRAILVDFAELKAIGYGPMVITPDGLSVGRFTLKSSGDVLDYPAMPGTCKLGEGLYLDGSEVEKACKRVSFACATYDSSSVLGGVSFRGGELCATDGSRMIYTVLGKDMPDTFIFPADGLKVMGSVFKSGARLTLDDKNIHCQDGNGSVLVVRAIPGEYPRYQELFPDNQENYLTYNRLELIQACESALACPDNKRLNLIKLCRDKVASPCGVFKANMQQCSSSSDMPITVNAKYLVQFLKLIKDADIRLELGLRNIEPIVIKADNSQYLIMPVQKNKGETVYQPDKVEEKSAPVKKIVAVPAKRHLPKPDCRHGLTGIEDHVCVCRICGKTV